MQPYLTTTQAPSTTYSPQRRKWADCYLPAVRAVLADLLIQPASFRDDTERATDLVVSPARISWRVRSHHALRFFPQLTIRTGEPEKLASADGPDWMLCCWAAPSGTDIEAWVAVDARRLGQWLLAHQNELRWRTNADGSVFTAVDPIRIGGCVLAAQQAEMAA